MNTIKKTAEAEANAQPAETTSQQDIVEASVLHRSAHLSWYHVDHPESPLLDELALKFGFHELEVEDCRHVGQRAKVEEYDNHLFVVGLRLDFDPGDLEVRAGELHIFVGHDFVVTVTNGFSPSVEAVVPRVHASAKMQRPDRVLHALLDYLVDGYPRAASKIEEYVDDLEEQVFESPKAIDLSDILSSKRVLVEMRRAIEGMRDVVSSLMRQAAPYYRSDMAAYWRDLFDHLLRALSMVEAYRDMLHSVLDTQVSLTAHRTNEIMKVLTVYATMALPLVVITGYFGMNFEHLPFKDMEYGVAIVHVLMLGLAAGLLIYFRRKKWL